MPFRLYFKKICSEIFLIAMTDVYDRREILIITDFLWQQG